MVIATKALITCMLLYDAISCSFFASVVDICYSCLEIGLLGRREHRRTQGTVFGSKPPNETVLIKKTYQYIQYAKDQWKLPEIQPPSSSGCVPGRKSSFVMSIL